MPDSDNIKRLKTEILARLKVAEALMELDMTRDRACEINTSIRVASSYANSLECEARGLPTPRPTRD